MAGQFMLVLAVATGAAIASPLGGAVTMMLRPSTLLLSIFVGFAGGALMGAFAFEMMPKALELTSIGVAVAGFSLGFGCVYALDLFVNRAALAGPRASQVRQVQQFHKAYRPRAGKAVVLAGATSVEELIEGVTIGIGMAIEPSVAFITGLAICIDNVSEALSIGEMMREENAEDFRRPILKWTGLIGASVFVSALAGWFLLRGLPQGALGLLLAAGAGGMFYLTVADLIPEAEEHQYQQSAAIAAAAGFLLIFVLVQLA